MNRGGGTWGPKRRLCSALPRSQLESSAQPVERVQLQAPLALQESCELSMVDSKLALRMAGGRGRHSTTGMYAVVLSVPGVKLESSKRIAFSHEPVSDSEQHFVTRGLIQ